MSPSIPPSSPVLLLVEDEPALARIVQESLAARGFTVHHAADGEQGLRLFRQLTPALVLLDVMLPRRDGFELARLLRRDDPAVPLIFLTARTQPADVVQGFELGASDYVRKPFSLDELVARIRARLAAALPEPAAAPAPPAGPVVLGSYCFDYPRQQLTLPGTDLPATALTHREAELLRCLLAQRNQVLTRSDVLRELWGDDSFFNGRSLDVFITRLRRYLRHDAEVQILNVRGVGYKLLLP